MEGTVVTLHNHIMLVYIPTTEMLRKFDELLDVIKNLENHNGDLTCLKYVNTPFVGTSDGEYFFSCLWNHKFLNVSL
jgi:hypothetical protein